MMPDTTDVDHNSFQVKKKPQKQTNPPGVWFAWKKNKFQTSAVAMK